LLVSYFFFLPVSFLPGIPVLVRGLCVVFTGVIADLSLLLGIPPREEDDFFLFVVFLLLFTVIVIGVLVIA